MAWVAVDKDGEEYIFGGYKPTREDDYMWYPEQDRYGDLIGDYVSIPSGSIEKLIGRVLTWDDEPVELSNENPN